MKKERLLQTKLSDLDLSIEKSWVSPYIDQLYRELKEKDIHFRPKIWISDDWFSPDGTAGFAIPFYLLRKDLLSLEKEVIGYAEGATAQKLMMLLRHETAHALDNAFHLRKIKSRQLLFGKTSKRYPTSYIPKPDSKNFVKHLPDNYAQSHPDEDWAETFSVWLTPNLNWEARYKNTHALDKLRCLDSIMKKLPPQRCFSNKQVDDISGLDITLENYFKIKKRRLKVKEKSPLYTVFKNEFKHAGKRSAFEYINKNRDELLRKLAKNTGLPHNKTINILNELKAYCKEEKLYMSYYKNVNTLVNSLSCPKVINHQKRVIM